MAQPLAILSIVLTPLLIQNLRQSVAARFLLANMAIPLLILYNPVTAPLLGQLITPWLLWRLTWICPVALVVGFFLYRVMNWLEQALANRSLSTYLRQFIPVLVIILLALSLNRYIVDGWGVLQAQQYKSMTGSEQALLAHLRHYIPADSVVMAEPRMNTFIPAFANSVQLLTFRGESTHVSVATDIDLFYRARLVDTSVLHILNRWQVQYIIINRNHELAIQFNLLPALFTRLYQNSEYELYQRLPGSESHPIITGNSYFIQGNWGEALPYYQQALTLNPHDSLAYGGLGQVYQAQGQPLKARWAYKQAIAAQFDNILAHLAVAKLYEAEGKTAAAIRQYRTAIKLQPHHRPLFEALGDLYLALGQKHKAFNQYRQAVPPSPDKGAYYLALGKLCRIKGLPEESLAAYKQVLSVESALTRRNFLWIEAPHSRSDPRTEMVVRAYIGLGALYEAEDRPDQAIKIYKQAVRLIPDNKQLYARLSKLYRQAGRLEEAIALYQDALNHHFNVAWPHLELGQLYLADQNRFFNYRGRWPWDRTRRVMGLEAALAEFRQALELEPSSAEAYRQLGRAYHQAGQPDKAMAAYQQAVAVNGGWAWSWVGLGRLYLQAGSPKAALAQFKQAILREYDHREAYTLLGQTYLRQGNPEAAIHLYRQALTTNPGRAWPALRLGQIYRARGEVDQALAAYHQAIALEPTQAQGYIQLGNFYVKRQDWPYLIQLYEHALRQGADHVDIYIQLGDAYQKLDKPDLALSYYRRGALLWPENLQLQQRLRN
jgi:tetratricopeptide (TPR) repeat protein